MNILRSQQRRKGLAYGLDVAPVIAQRLFDLSRQPTAKYLLEAFPDIYFRRLEDDLRTKFRRLTDDDIRQIMDKVKLRTIEELTRMDNQTQTMNSASAPETGSVIERTNHDQIS